MNPSLRWSCLALAVAALGWWWHADQSPLHRPPGVLVAEAPAQEALETPPALLHKRDFTLKPLARFSLSARVLSRADYHWDHVSKLAPVDLALGWGRMSDSAVLEKVDISQSSRFYFWQVSRFPIPEHEIIESSANMHLIPADDTIERAIKRTRIGDIVSFDGYLVEAERPDGFKWTSSLTRSDSGPGACELVWVESFSIAAR